MHGGLAEEKIRVTAVRGRKSSATLLQFGAPFVKAGGIKFQISCETWRVADLLLSV